MPKLRILSGKEAIKIFSSFGFSVVNQKGSHIKLRRIIGSNTQNLTIPNHRSIDRGTLKEIYNQARVYIDDSDLHKNFYR
jgi:predicted RNA binding protein YcfA (HicA-like mRNA interferase family)